MVRSALLAAVAVVIGLPVYAQNIITVSGSPTNNPPASLVYGSWTQTGTFNNVTIQANLYSCFGPGKGTAYLTLNGRNQVNQVAINPNLLVDGGNNGASANVTIFSGLTLGPGTYYLTINPLSGQGGNECNVLWNSTTSPSPSVGAGVTNNNFATASSVNAYPPASSFKSQFFFLYSAVAGSVSNSVPALSPGAMFATMILLLSSGLFLMRKYRPQD